MKTIDAEKLKEAIEPIRSEFLGHETLFRKIIDAIDSLAQEPNESDRKFIAHIQTHLKPGDFVICKICGKSAREITAQEPEEPVAGAIAELIHDYVCDITADAEFEGTYAYKKAKAACSELASMTTKLAELGKANQYLMGKDIERDTRLAEAEAIIHNFVQAEDDGLLSIFQQVIERAREYLRKVGK